MGFTLNAAAFNPWISFFGDSIFEQNAHVGVQRAIFAAYPSAQIITFKDGLSGDVMNTGAGRFPTAVGNRRPLPTHTIIEYGTNDVGSGPAGLAAFTTACGTMQTNVAAKVPSVKNILYIGIMGADTTNQTDLTNYNAAINTTATAAGSFYVDMQRPYQALLTAGFNCNPHNDAHPSDTIQTFPTITFIDLTTNTPQQIIGGTYSGKQWYSNCILRAITFA